MRIDFLPRNIFIVCIIIMLLLLMWVTDHVYANKSVSENLFPHSPQVGIIIDDLGNGMKGSDEILTIHAPLTVAIMPFLKTSREDAIRAHQAGFEVLLHIPMEPVNGNKSWLGPGAITTDLLDQEIKDLVRKEIDSIPFVVGMNNHMGSKATADKRVMKDVLEVVKERGLFVVDSRTTLDTQLETLSKQMSVPCVHRTVFLDNKKSVSYIIRQIKLLIDGAQTQGWSVGIGHVGNKGISTYRAIKSMLPYIEKSGVSVVPISKIVKDLGTK